MSNNRSTDPLLAALKEGLSLAGSLGEDLKTQAQSSLMSQAEKAGLVTREEYERALMLLEKAQQRITELESKLEN